MRTRRPDHSAFAPALLGAVAVLLAAGGSARAQVAADQPAGLLVFPKVVVDRAGFLNGGVSQDTVIELNNTDDGNARSLHCFWVNSTGRCDNIPILPCDPNTDDPVLNCQVFGGRCQAQWTVSNFFIEFTPAQPIGFVAGDNPQAPLPCDGTTGCGIQGGSIGPVTDPFVGELKCVEVNNINDAQPVDGNHFTGSARIYEVTGGAPGSVDVRQYNAVGVRAIEGQVNTDTTLCLGTTPSAECGTEEYAACPGTLILNHFFEDSFPFGDNRTVRTVLTLVPCTERLEEDPSLQTVTAVQLAIINEFEQRFSSATRVDCFKSIRLADLDTRAGAADDYSSIFSVGVQGTLTGQTRVRGVPSSQAFHGLLGVAEELYTDGVAGTAFSAAFNLNYDGSRLDSGEGDEMHVPVLP
ncbi:MAG: hypothetical protein HY699_06710 [Deltaproteobacteria bacterium]|nr:hypothetical protein [Deltaproteobacteria bacterium]